MHSSRLSTSSVECSLATSAPSPRPGILDPTHSHRADLMQTTGDPRAPFWALGQGVAAGMSLDGYQLSPGPS